MCLYSSSSSSSQTPDASNHPFDIRRSSQPQQLRALPQGIQRQATESEWLRHQGHVLHRPRVQVKLISYI